MNKLLCALFASFFLMVLFLNTSLADRSVIDSMTRDSVEAIWGRPIRNGNSVCIYHHDDEYLIAAYSSFDTKSGDNQISDYVIINSNREFIEGTILESYTIDYTVHELFHNMSNLIQQSYDNGSGSTIYTIMTSDGYVIEWITDDVNSFLFLMGGDCRIIDSITADHSSYSYETPVAFFVKRFFRSNTAR